MPKIETNRDELMRYIGKDIPLDRLAELLPAAKAELDDIDHENDTLKIELNDTNRPDLWSTAGLGRLLKMYTGGRSPVYGFFSTSQNRLACDRRQVVVDPSVREYRPFITAFAVSGKPVDDSTLKEIIQTQEKLCWNFGQKRKSIAMGIYRSDLMEYPVRYRGADPDSTSFVPLQMEKKMTLREILREHPKGQEFGSIVESFDLFPYLEDARGNTLSFPPIINSNSLGSVQTGDTDLFVELTGNDLDSLILSASIVACDLSDAGFEILPVRIVYPYETKYGREIVIPYYFQKRAEVTLQAVNKHLGVELTREAVMECLKKMGLSPSIDGDTFGIRVPEYRNDFLHPVDVIEDIMIAKGMSSFEPVMPTDFTVGRLSKEEGFGRGVRDIMTGLGFQEMIYFYLGSETEFIRNMLIDGEDYIRIANPMTENYEIVRGSIMPCLLKSESVSGNAVYPHAIFEIGKTALLDDNENYGTKTWNTLGFMIAERQADFNRINSVVSAIFYYLGKEYSLKEAHDPRLIEGRSANIMYRGKNLGLFGEVHPQILDNWGIQMPCVIGEITLDHLL